MMPNNTKLITIVCGAVLAGGFLFAVVQELWSDNTKYDVTQIFAGLKLDSATSINSLVKADTVCAIPPGIDPLAYLSLKFPGRNAERHEFFDSESKWFILAMNDHEKNARILDIKRKNVETELDQAVCSRNLIVVVRRRGDGKIVAAVEQ